MPNRIEVNIDQITQLNQKYVEEINQYLPNGNKVRPTLTFDIRFEKPETTQTITIAERLKAKREFQNATLERLAKEYKYTIPKYPTVISSLFLTSDTPEADEYNEELFMDYINHPKKYLYEEVRKVLDIKASDLYELSDNPLKNAKFYELNFSVIENASKLVDIIKNDPEITKELKDALPAMESLIKLATFPKNLTMRYEKNMLAFPELNSKQAAILNNEYKNNPDLNIDCKKYIETMSDEKNTYKPKSYFHNIHRLIRSNPNENDIFKTFGKYMTKLESYSRENGHEEEPIDMDNVVFSKGGQIGLRIIKTPTARIGLECITNEVKDKYINIWQTKFVEERGVGSKFDIDAIEFEHRGGFFERLRGTTSDEYKEMILALREFNDPNSKNYLNYDNLKEKAQGYIAHKEEQGYGTTKRYTGTSKKRKELADAILEMENKHKDIMRKIDNGLSTSIKVPESEIEKQQIFESDDMVDVIGKYQQPKIEQQKIEDQKFEIEEINDDSPNLNINEFVK